MPQCTVPPLPCPQALLSELGLTATEALSAENLPTIRAVSAGAQLGVPGTNPGQGCSASGLPVIWG